MISCKWNPPSYADGCEPFPMSDDDFGEMATDGLGVFRLVFAEYEREFALKSSKLKAELGQIDSEIGRIGDEILKVPSETLRKKWYTQLGDLEARKREIEPQLVPLTSKAEALMDQLRAIRQTIKDAEGMKVAKLLDSFIERVEPQFEERGSGKTRKVARFFTGAKFHGKSTAEGFLPGPCIFGASRMGKGSSKRTT